jgi:alpha-galactosidase
MKKLFFSLLSITILCVSPASAESNPTWSGIQVDVSSDQTVETTQSLLPQADGFQRLNITLSNKGQKSLTIQKINIRIPLAMPLSDDLEMVYGGSCMGRTPLLRQNIGKQTKQSNSHMFEMLRLKNEQYLFAGSLSWRIFLPNFNIKENQIVIWSDGEGKQLQPGQSIQYEQIVLNIANNWVDLLDQFGSAIAVENNITSLKPADFKGWATWDYYGRVFSADDIYGNMDQLNKLAPDSNMIQIDGGWWTERGDYQSVRPDLKGGIKAIADRIASEGKTPGLHFDGFRGDANSEICKKHPEYFLHDQDGKLIVETNPKTDKVMKYTFFDYSHPGARAHIAECVNAMKEWGISYFKVDFMRYGLENDIKNKSFPNDKILSLQARLH